ncbi:hypothetical protein DXG01_000006 [Tephrocybe rancida]|nr:hypothetical protein DXG01_000006 [Tephrocybe rancida]
MDLRLFSSGGGSELIEWDLERACVRRTISSQGGSIWCMAANPASNLLALGCEDGTVRLLSLSNDTLTHYRRFDRVKCRVLSIAWGPPVPQYPQKEKRDAAKDSDSDDDNDDTWNDTWLVTGSSDSSVRKWDVATGRVIDRMGTDKVRGERTLVWAVGVLGDGTIVSGDSLGMVKFWDSKTCTQLQSFQGHGADVLCLAVGPEGNTVFTSGVDQKISLFSLVKTGTSGHSLNTPSSSSRWVQSCSRRMHSHDVRALATWPPYTALPQSHKRRFPIDISPILASGGLDMSVVVTPAALPSTTVVKVVNPLSTSVHCTFEDSYHRRLAYSSGVSGISAIQVARKARLISCIRDSSLSVWRVKGRPSAEAHDPLEADAPIVDPESAGWEKVLEMDLNVHTNLIASGISDDGQWLVVSDMHETKLFSLTTDAKNQLTVRRIRDFSTILQAHLPDSTTPSTGGQAFRFTPDSSKLVMSTAFLSYILVVDLTDEKPRVLRRFDQHRFKDSLSRDRVVKGRKTGGDVEMGNATGEDSEASEEEAQDPTSVVASILRMSISPDGQWLATADDRARTHIFNLDSIQVLAFDQRQPDVLIMAFPDNTLQIYNVESRQFPSWGKELCSNLPKRFTQAHDPVLGVAFDIAEPTSGSSDARRHALFWGSTWICKLSMTNSAPRGPTKKRRRESVAPSTAAPVDESYGDFKMIMHYRPILHLDFLAGGELVVVERPLVDVLSDLPPAYFKHKYGTS